MRILLLSFLLSQLLFAEEPCSFDKHFVGTIENNLIAREAVCDNLPPIKTEKELEDILTFFFEETKKKDDPDRHKVTARTNKCLPTKNSKTLIIAFEGTGAYEPLVPPTMANFNKCFGGNLDPKLKNKVYSKMKDIFKSKMGRDAKWSGLQAGIMEEMMFLEEGSKIDWYSFPSEEVEQLAGPEKIKDFSLRQLHDSIKDSVASNPKGIQNARACIVQYMAEARRLGIQPKIVLTSHSSGGRSLVKFAEHMKKDVGVGVDVDLAFSIDPVKEAHHAVEEVLPQKVGEPARYLKWKITDGRGETYPYSAVWHRKQPSSLYQPSNVDEHINFYQLDDRLGLKMGGDALRFGIKGSPMDKAQNIHVKNVGIGGHGDITYDETVLDLFRTKMDNLLK
jgi:hypothetical protein